MNHVLEKITFKLMKYPMYVNEDLEVIYIYPSRPEKEITILQRGNKFVVSGCEWYKEFDLTASVDDICDCVEKGI